MTKRNIRLSSVVLIIGLILLVFSLVLLLVSQVEQQQAVYHAKEIIAQIRMLIPAVHDEVPDDRINMTMPAMEVGKISYCGLIELPAYHAEFPVRELWSKYDVSKIPCRYLGSIYDGSLIIGGGDKEGQFDFMQQITDSDVLYITDMVGARYTYTVTDVKKTGEISTAYLTALDADLILFTKNTFSLDYTVVLCHFK